MGGRQMGVNVGKIACRTWRHGTIIGVGGGYWLNGDGWMDGVWEWRIQYQHADAKMQMRGWMNAVYGNAARLMFRRTSEKTRCPGGQKCGVANNAEVCQYSTVWTAGARGAENARDVPRLLHVDEEVALEDVFPFLVFLGLFVRFVLLTRVTGIP
jgi:hypothetical protein